MLFPLRYSPGTAAVTRQGVMSFSARQDVGDRRWGLLIRYTDKIELKIRLLLIRSYPRIADQQHCWSVEGHGPQKENNKQETQNAIPISIITMLNRTAIIPHKMPNP